jgi:hypothetical protein
VGAATGEVLMFEGGEPKGSVLMAGGLRLTCMLGHAKVRCPSRSRGLSCLTIA